MIIKNTSKMDELRGKIRNEVISARILAKTVDEAVNKILLLVNENLKDKKLCPHCNSPNVIAWGPEANRCNHCSLVWDV